MENSLAGGGVAGPTSLLMLSYLGLFYIIGKDFPLSHLEAIGSLLPGSRAGGRRRLGVEGGERGVSSSQTQSLTCSPCGRPTPLDWETSSPETLCFTLYGEQSPSSFEERASLLAPWGRRLNLRGLSTFEIDCHLSSLPPFSERTGATNS